MKTKLLLFLLPSAFGEKKLIAASDDLWEMIEESL